MNIANGVTGVRIVGLTLVNGRAGDTDDASGGCMFMGEDTDVHLSNITFQNCSAPGMSMSGEERESERERERGRGCKHTLGKVYTVWFRTKPQILKPKP